MFGPTTPEMLQNSGWFLAFGTALLLLGIAAIIRSFVTTAPSVVFVGSFLVCGGILENIHMFMVGNWTGFWLHLLVGIFLAFIGLVMLAKPTMSAEAVTLVVSIFLLVSGLYQLIFALRTHVPGWGWHTLNGSVATVLGVALLAQRSVSGLRVVGLFVGIDLVFYGWTWITLALSLRKS